MSITPDDILEPAGVISPEWFPSTVIDHDEREAALLATLQEYIADGESRGAGIADPTAQDAYVRAWATHRAATAVYLRLSFNPATVTLAGDAGGSSRTYEQIQTFRRLAENYLGLANALLPVATFAPKRVPQSGTVTHTFRW